MSALRPFVGAWSIWLTGYALLLVADFMLRASGLSREGVSANPLWVALPVTVAAGAAAGFFLAAGVRWRAPYRVLLLLVQVPVAWLVAVGMGYSYLCLFGPGCP